MEVPYLVEESEAHSREHLRFDVARTLTPCGSLKASYSAMNKSKRSMHFCVMMCTSDMKARHNLCCHEQ